jgi:hypothetical protein
MRENSDRRYRKREDRMQRRKGRLREFLRRGMLLAVGGEEV